MEQSVTIRLFTDSKGREWRVWATYPVHVGSTAEAYRGGWLTFQSGELRRRLTPVPPHWQDVSDARLELICNVAEAVTERRSTPSAGGPVESGGSVEELGK